MPLEPGRLIHLVDIQQHNGAQDPNTGEPLNGDGCWERVAQKVFAEVRTLSGRDYVQAMQSGYVATHQVSLYWRPDISTRTTRFLFNGVPLYVIHPNNLEGLNYGLEVLCRSGEQV